MTEEQQTTIRLLLSGLACGDSLGSTSEFIPQAKIPALYGKLKHTGWPYKQIGGGMFNWKAGAPTDDTDQAMCLVRSYLELGKFDAADVGTRLVAWKDSGPPDIGGTTSRTLNRLRQPKGWSSSGQFEFIFNPENAANGSLMRNGVLPALMIGEDLDALFRATVQHSIITHYHPLAVLCCAAHSWLITDELAGWKLGPAHHDRWLDSFYKDWTNYVAGEDDPYVGEWLDNVRENMQWAGQTLTEADWDCNSFNPYMTDFGGRDGYVLLTLQIAVWALLWSKKHEPFDNASIDFPPEVLEKRGASTIAWTAMIGHDSDTYGAVAGPLLAAAHGSFPAEMTEGLKALEEFDSIVAGNGRPRDAAVR